MTTYPEFYIKSTAGVYVYRKGGYEFKHGVQPATWTKRATAEKKLEAILAENPTAVIVDNTASIQPTPTVERNLRAILALCDAPHFTSDRKYRIAELASEALSLLQK